MSEKVMSEQDMEEVWVQLRNMGLYFFRAYSVIADEYGEREIRVIGTDGKHERRFRVMYNYIGFTGKPVLEEM